MKKLYKFGIGLFVLLMFLFVSCSTVNESAAGNSGMLTYNVETAGSSEMLPNNVSEAGKKDSVDSKKTEKVSEKLLESNNSSADYNVQELSKSFSPLGYDITAEDVLDYELAFHGKIENFVMINLLVTSKLGYVFYDCDADNENGNSDGLRSSECGWRFLGAALEDLPEDYVWGDDGHFSTNVGIEEGWKNTNIIVNNASNKRKNNATMACVMYAGGGYSDWFLPSRDELDLMYVNLKTKGIGNFKDAWYWSGSEGSNNYAWRYNFAEGWRNDSGRRNSYFHVRPVRAFI